MDKITLSFCLASSMSFYAFAYFEKQQQEKIFLNTNMQEKKFENMKIASMVNVSLFD